MIALRYFWDAKAGKLRADRGTLALAVAEGLDVENVVHWHLARDRRDALREAEAELRRGLWHNWARYSVTVIWTFVAARIFWWLPLGLQGRFGPAYFALLAPFAAVTCLSLRNVVHAVVSLWRLRRAVRQADKAPIRIAAHIPPPSWLLAKEPNKGLRPLRLLLVGLLLPAVFVFVTGFAVGLPGHPAVVHPPGGDWYPVRGAEALPPTAWWEYTDAVVEGVAYGALHFDQGAKELLVIKLVYAVRNDPLHGPGDVHGHFWAWASNLARYFSVGMEATMPAGLSEAGKAKWVAGQLDHPEILDAVAANVERASAELLQCRAQVKASIETISLAEYRKLALKRQKN